MQTVVSMHKLFLLLLLLLLLLVAWDCLCGVRLPSVDPHCRYELV